MKMPEVDRKAASAKAVAARRARAALKEKLRAGQLSPLKVLEQAQDCADAAAKLRVTEFLGTLSGIGAIKIERILNELNIAPSKRLGGLGRVQHAKLVQWLLAREGRQGVQRLTVLAGPTAVGKGTVVSHLLANYPQVHLSVSATTRKPRPGEVDGKHYYFVSETEFDRMLAHNELLEWATVHGKHRYGTPRKPIEQAQQAGHLVLLEIDLQGARQVRNADPAAKLVFLAPPSMEELHRRLLGRGTESTEEQERRLRTAQVEMAAASEFDYQIVNEQVAAAAAELFRIMNEC